MTAPKQDFDDIKASAESIKSAYGIRDGMYRELTEMYMLTDGSLPTEDWIKKTISPDARNAVLGMARLLSATEPVWVVPYNSGESGSEELSSKIELFLEACWRSSGQTRKKKPHYLAAITALLFDEVHIAVQSTAEMARFTKDPRMAAIAERTPVLFEVLSPSICYPVYDGQGLAVHYSVRNMAVADITSRFDQAQGELTGVPLTQRLGYHEYWDATRHVVWHDRSTTPLLDEPHGLSRIPIASGLIEGNELFDEDQGYSTRQPLLYTLLKTGLWKRQNLSLTMNYSLIAKIASSADFVHIQGPDRAPVEIKADGPVNIVEAGPGHSVQPLQKNVIDPAVREGLELAERKIQESTIYRQTLGESLGANAPYSMVALLNQAGRLPLTIYQRQLSLIISDAGTIALELTKRFGGGKAKTRVKVEGRAEGTKEAQTIELTPAEIPDFPEIEATLDIDLPQDLRQNVQTAQMALAAGLMTKAQIRQELLKLGQSDRITEEIWSEQAADAIYQTQVQGMVQMEQLKQQMQLQQMAQQMQGTQPPPPGGPGMPPQGMPPQGMLPEMAPGMAPPGAEGIPPELAAMMGQGGPGMGVQPPAPGLPQAGPGPLANLPGEEAPPI